MFHHASRLRVKGTVRVGVGIGVGNRDKIRSGLSHG